MLVLVFLARLLFSRVLLMRVSLPGRNDPSGSSLGGLPYNPFWWLPSRRAFLAAVYAPGPMAPDSGFPVVLSCSLRIRFASFLRAAAAEPELDDELSLLLLEELLLELLFVAVSLGAFGDVLVFGSLSMTTLWPDVGPSISISDAKGSGSSRLSDGSMTTVSVLSRRAAASASFTALLIVAGSGEIPGAGMRGGVLSMMCL